MIKEDFFSSQSIEQAIRNRKRTVNNEKIDWMKIQKKIKFFKLIQIENYGNCNTQFDVCLRKRGKNNTIAFSDVNFEPLYMRQRRVKYKKCADLQKLMHDRINFNHFMSHLNMKMINLRLNVPK